MQIVLMLAFAIVFIPALVRIFRQELEKERIAKGKLKQCPFCAETIKPTALVCPHCSRELPP